MQPGLAYSDARGRVFFDSEALPLAGDGIEREASSAELIPAPPGTVTTMLPGRRPRLVRGRSARRTALAALLPIGYTRLLLPAYARDAGAPVLPLFGYTFACAIDDALHVAAAKTDEPPDWQPRFFPAGMLERIVEQRRAADPQNRLLEQVERCALEYGCFTAQNVFLACGEAALPVSPRCNAACVGCISEQDLDAGIPSPQERIAFEPQVDEIVRVAVAHFERVPEGIVSFGQGCEGEPLLRASAIASAIEKIRGRLPRGTINLNTNGSLPKSLRRLIDAGLQAVRISLSSFRPDVYAAYYRPVGYALDDVFESIRMAGDAGLRVSLNLLTHPGVTDDRAELLAMETFLRDVRPALIQTRTLNIDPDVYFACVGRPAEPLGMLHALDRIGRCGIEIGNVTRPAMQGSLATPTGRS
ncbi:MAG TPA: radical SAM protein [Candidatus Binatia bacterium]|nr:radical SAM protein [Candidatus Binatia bacterium]